MKNIWKVCSIFNRQNFTRTSYWSEISPTGEIGNSPVTIMGNSMSKVQEKRSMSKTNFFMMKYERTKGYEMVFTVFKPNFGFGANLGQQLN